MIIKYFTDNDRGAACEVTLPDIERIEKSQYSFEDALEAVEKEEREAKTAIWRGQVTIDKDGSTNVETKKEYTEIENRDGVYLWISNQPSSDFEFERVSETCGCHSVNCIDDLCHGVPITRIIAIGPNKAYEIITTKRAYVMSDSGKTIDRIN